MGEQKAIWQRIEASGKGPGETAQAYEAAKLYFELAADRSLEAVGQKLGKSKALMERWSKRWNWVKRAAAYDRHVADSREDNLQQKRAEDAELWIRRDRELRERFYRLGELIVEKAERMYREFPERDIQRKEVNEGQTVILNVRTKHSLSGLAQMFSTGAELQRLAVGIHPGSTPLDNLDLNQLSREDLIKLLMGEPIKLKEHT